MYFGNDDLIDIQAYINRHITLAATRGLRFVEESDPHTFKTLWETLPSAQQLPSMFDIDQSHLHMDNFWWPRFVDANGATVGIAAQRAFDTDDFARAVQHYEIFFSRPVQRWEPLLLHPEAPNLSGRIVIGGAFWFHPSDRGKGKAYAASQLIQGISLRHFRPDYKVALFRESEKARGQAKAEGYLNTAPFMTGPYPPHEFNPIDLFIGWQTRDEMLVRIRRAERTAAE